MHIWNVVFGVSARSSRHPRGVYQSTGSVTAQNGPDNTRYGNFFSLFLFFVSFFLSLTSFHLFHFFFHFFFHLHSLHAICISQGKVTIFRSVIKWVYWRCNVLCSRELAAHGKLFRRAFQVAQVTAARRLLPGSKEFDLKFDRWRICRHLLPHSQWRWSIIVPAHYMCSLFK